MIKIGWSTQNISFYCFTIKEICYDFSRQKSHLQEFLTPVH